MREEKLIWKYVHHLFDNTLSPSYSNYALRNAAANNERQFRSEASVLLRRNSFADDFLKSAKTLQEAVTLISYVTGMCGPCGFNLTKFISNTKK